MQGVEDMVEMTCSCGKIFNTLPCRLKMGYGCFCSRPCASRYAIRKKQKDKAVKSIDFIIVNSCFECTSHALDLDGYPLLKRNGTMNRISRYIYTQCFGEIDKGKIIRHTCDNRKCINPEHLIPGTTKENSRDMVERGRSSKGEKNGSSKITLEDVIKIRKLRKDGKTVASIGDIFNISYTQVRNIITFKSWSYV